MDEYIQFLGFAPLFPMNPSKVSETHHGVPRDKAGGI